MIHVEKDYDCLPPQLLSDRCEKKIKEAIESTGTYRASGDYYRKPTIEALKKLYNHKCGYCEHDSGNFVVDHYRPVNNKQNDDHAGYRWLSYEWSNLILCCHGCNNHKSSSFPIMPDGIRMVNPGVFRKDYYADSKKLLLEKSYLLNPEIDYPDKHINFLPNGKVEGISERGKKTIEICKLDRDDLIIARKKVIGYYYNELITDIDSFESKKCSTETFEFSINKFFKNLFSLSNNNNSFLILRWRMFVNFDSFFIEKLKSEKQATEKVLEMIQKIYESWIS